MPVPTDNVHEIQTTVTQTSQVQSLSSVTPSVAGNSIPPMTGQCTSPVLLEYRKYLQSYYKTRNLAAADKFLPTLDTPYISLAIVTSHYSNQDKSDEFTKATLHGGVDQILKIKKPIVFQNLLTPSEGSNKPVKFILVEGPPGIGKSTFAWEVCRRWEEIPSLKAYDAVVLLKLRERWVLNATSPAELFRYPAKPMLSENILEELNQSQGLNLLLILDGFDEVSHSFHDNSVIKHILSRVLLPECTIILTTRPSAKSTLEIDFQPLVNKHLEIIGFPEEERVKYITEVFSKQPELQVNFLKYMFNVPHIKSMMYIPLNCAVIAKVCSESKRSSRLAIPRTRTQLYKALIHSFLVRYMSLNGGGIACSSTLPEYIPIKEMELFKTLAKFAFDSYHEGETKKVTFFEEDIPRGLVYFGLMNESIEMYADKGMERSYSFLHLSLQEYLAAWHIANSYSVHFQVAYHHVVSDSDSTNFEKPEDLCTYYKGDNTEESALITKLEPISSTLGEPAVFLAGITGLKCESVQKNLWEICFSDLNDNSIALRSLYEAQNPSILASISFDRNLSIGHDPYDSYAVSYCISHCSNEVSLDIAIYESSSSIEAFCRGLHDHCKSTVLRVNRLYVNIVDEDAQSIHWLADTIKVFMTGVKHISNYMSSLSSDVPLNPEKSHLSKQISMTHVLPSLKNLKSVRFLADRLSNTPPSHPICQAIENSITELELDVKLPYSSYDVKSPTALFINDLLTSILRSKLIRKLSLANISRENMANVHTVIMQCPNLANLKLMRCRLGYDGMLYICNALRYNSSIEEILIEDYEQDIDPDKICYPLKEVPLPNRATCTDIILGLNDILKENNTLERLDISTGLFQDWTSDKLIRLVEYEPFAQFNVGRIRNGTAHGLRRSYSLSDLTPLNTTVSHVVDDDGKIYKTTFTHVGMFFTRREVVLRQRKKQRMKMCYNISFTAPDTDILTSFSYLDPRLKKCLCITDSHLLEVQSELIYDMKTDSKLKEARLRWPLCFVEMQIV